MELKFILALKSSIKLASSDSALYHSVPHMLSIGADDF